MAFPDKEIVEFNKSASATEFHWPAKLPVLRWSVSSDQQNYSHEVELKSAAGGTPTNWLYERVYAQEPNLFSVTLKTAFQWVNKEREETEGKEKDRIHFSLFCRDYYTYLFTK